jgi:hypothetical protein
MTLASFLALCITFGILWGGLATLLAIAMRKERQKFHEKTNEDASIPG